MKEKRKSKSGRNPKLDPAVYRYTVRFNEEEHNRFLAMFGKSGVYARSVFLKAHFFGQPFKVLKVDKTFYGGFCATVAVTSSTQTCDKWSLNIESPGRLNVWGIDYASTSLYTSKIKINAGETRFVGLCTEAPTTSVIVSAFCS